MIRLQVTVPTGMGLVYTKKRQKKLMAAAGREIAADARTLIRRAAGGGVTYRGSGSSKYRPYKPGPYTASAPGQPPVNVTGTLLRGIVVRPFKSGEGVAVRDRTFYALFLEAGAKGGGRKGRRGVPMKGRSAANTARVLMPRPFLSMALSRKGASLNARIRAAIVDDIEFRRVKA